MVSDSARAFLQRLLETPSPSGFEGPNAAHFRDYVAPFADEVHTDPLGNTIAVVNPGGSPRVMLAGHIDEIGFIVNYISDEVTVIFDRSAATTTLCWSASALRFTRATTAAFPA
jgi:endoglucanase